jgi:glyoxylase-like metal-dependent hydrolase (beta-lactamase superfamily II)
VAVSTLCCLVLGHQHRDHLLAVVELHAAHAARRAAHRPHVVLVEAHRLAGVGEQHHVVLPSVIAAPIR